jgi:thermitase
LRVKRVIARREFWGLALAAVLLVVSITGVLLLYRSVGGPSQEVKGEITSLHTTEHTYGAVDNVIIPVSYQLERGDSVKGTLYLRAEIKTPEQLDTENSVKELTPRKLELTSKTLAENYTWSWNQYTEYEKPSVAGKYYARVTLIEAFGGGIERILADNIYAFQLGLALPENVVSGKVLVGFVNEVDVTSTRANDIINQHGGTVISTDSTLNYASVQVQEGGENNFIRAVIQHLEVAYAYPEHLVGVSFTPTDPDYFKQWSYPKIRAPEAWDITTGSASVVVAVVDTGVDYTHPELAGRMWTDGSGHYGYDFVDGDSDPKDLFGHGTHVAGTISAEMGNGAGGVGVAPGVKIMAVRVLDADGSGYSSWVASGIRWAADHGADIINLSLGSWWPFTVERDAVNYAYEKGCVIVAAAGNDGWGSVGYPAAYESAIAVSATDQGDSKADFSNYGPEIEVAAPGVSIYSTMPTYHVELNNWGYSMNYDYLSGTSMATPHVSGAVALLLSKYPTLTNSEVRNALAQRSVDLGSLGRDEYYGYGRIDVYNLLAGTTPPSEWEEFNVSAESQHPYPNSYDGTWVIRRTGAAKIKVYFESMSTELGYDFVYFYDAENNELGRVGGMWAGYWSPEATGDTIRVRLVSDRNVQESGFKITKVAVLGGTGEPEVTEPEVPTSWEEFNFTLESPHPYSNGYDSTWLIKRTGATKIKVFFEKIETEVGYDFVRFYDAAGNELGKVSGMRTDYWSPEVTGDTIRVRLAADQSNTGWGIRITKVAAIGGTGTPQQIT